MHTRDEVLICCPSVDRWCGEKWDVRNPRACLRSLEFAPDSFSSDHFAMVRGVMNGRRSALAAAKLFSNTPVTPHGRLLVYEPALNLQDCLAEAETHGFVDSNDCPPWDLWVGFIRDMRTGYLLSWIPDYLVDVAQSGIDATSGGSLYWLDQSEEPWAVAFFQS